jgi:hypothetical protein
MLLVRRFAQTLKTDPGLRRNARPHMGPIIDLNLRSICQTRFLNMNIVHNNK